MKKAIQITDLSLEQWREFQRALLNDSYELLVLNKSEFPKGIKPELRKIRAIKCVTEDTDADFKFIHYCTENFTVPMAVFSLANTRKFQTNFILGIIQGFFSVGQGRFEESLQGIEQKKLLPEVAFHELLSARFGLIRKMFTLYQKYDEQGEAFMSWDTRGKRSMTRIAAEESGFLRTELGTKEIYYKYKESEESFDFEHILNQQRNCFAEARKRYHLEFYLRWIFQGKKMRQEVVELDIVIAEYCRSFYQLLLDKATVEREVVSL